MIIQNHIPQDQQLTSNFILLSIRDVKDISSVMDAFDHYPHYFACRIAFVFLLQKNIQETDSCSLKDRYVWCVDEIQERNGLFV